MHVRNKNCVILYFKTINRAPMTHQILTFMRKWTLPISILAGIGMYFAYVNMHFLDHTHELAHEVLSYLQPALIFTMLLLTFCKIRPSELHLCRWHFVALALQIGLFLISCLWIMSLDSANHYRVIIEGGMLCLVCPTATAAAVVTNKLGGNPSSLTTYTILINLSVAVLIPLIVPILHPGAGHAFLHDFTLIISKVFPLLFCPFLLAIILREFTPGLVKKMTSIPDLAFYLWAVSLSLAIAVTVRSIVHTTCPPIYLAGIALASLLACIIQFMAGRKIGRSYKDPISAAQSLGQKNTVFAIWLGYTFLDPVTSIAGGFYSIWHNVYNSYQLYQAGNKH